jgi:hypothetical protein
MGYYRTFIVKIWCDDTGELNRGYVWNAGTNNKKYFMNIEDLTGFMLSNLTSATDSLSTGNHGSVKHEPLNNHEDTSQNG